MRQLKVVMYHYVRDLKNSRYPDIKGMDYEKFKRQIRYLRDRYNIVRMEDVLSACAGSALPDNAMLLTFDDSYMDHFTHVFPVLDAYGIQGSFFIPAKTFVEKKLLDVNKIHFILAAGDIKELLPHLFSRLDYYRGGEFDFPSNEELFEQYGTVNRFDSREVSFVKRILQNGLPERLRHMISSELFRWYVGIPEDVFAGELYMNHDQIGTLKRKGMFIGVHGYDHYWLGKLSREAMEMVVLYEQELPFVFAALFDTKQGICGSYYCPIPEDVACVVERRGNGDIQILLKQEQIGGKVLFRVDVRDKKRIVIRMDLAESLLARDITGLELREVTVL